ncbi:MAG: lysylphosphatidylglycerol synthase transmembrane domain-containing protein [Pseudomonadota bacterium]
MIRIGTLAAGHRPARWRWALGWAMATGLIFLCLRHVAWGRFAADMRTLRPGWALLAAAFNGAVLLIWPLQWRLFLPADRRIPYPRMFRITSLAAMVMNTVPFMAGHVLGGILLSRHPRIDTGTAVSVLTIDQLCKGLVKAGMLLAALLLAPLPQWMHGGGRIVAAAAVVLTAVFAGVRHWGKAAPAGALEGFALRRWAVRLRAAGTPAAVGAGVFLAVAMKGLELAAICAVVAAFGKSPDIREALLVLVAVNMATLLSVAPGNLGMYETAAVLTYTWLGVDAGTAFSMALLQHLCFLLPWIGTGYAVSIAAALRSARRAGGGAADGGTVEAQVTGNDPVP